jgi:hypothetical protein
MPWDRLKKPDAALVARAMALVSHARPAQDEAGKAVFRLISENSPEFKSLKIKIAPQFAPMGPEHRALAAVLGVLPPAVLRDGYLTYADAVTAALTVQNGAAFFYGLQTSAIAYHDAALAEEIVRAVRRTRTLLCFENELFPVIGETRLDEVLLEMTAQWNSKRDILLWGLLEHHKAWSPALSERIVAAVREGGAESRSIIWTFGGSGYALHMHPSLLTAALEALEPWWRTQAVAKKWRAKLKGRMK